MTKKELMFKVKENAGVTTKVATEVIDAVFSEMAKELSRGGEIRVRDFGRLFVKETAKRNGFNPATNEPIVIPERKVVRFRSASSLAKKVRGE